MRLYGQISVQTNVDDFVEAAGHQKRLEEILRLVRDNYPDATLSVRERRLRKGGSLPRASGPRSLTGLVHTYDD